MVNKLVPIKVDRTLRSLHFDLLSLWIKSPMTNLIYSIVYVSFLGPHEIIISDYFLGETL